MTSLPLHLTVISTVSQPPIGKPLIGQARGQLRLTWRSYAGPPQPPLSGCAGLPQREACHLVLRSLPLPYSTAITDSLDSQVTHVPLRIQFTGVTQVPLPPLFRGKNRPLYAFLSCHMWHIARHPSSLTIYNSPFTISSGRPNPDLAVGAPSTLPKIY